MMLRRFLIALLYISLTSGFSACTVDHNNNGQTNNNSGGGDTGGGETFPDPAAGQVVPEGKFPPQVSLGLPFAAHAGETITLPSWAHDEDGVVVSYEWSQLDGQEVTLNTTDAETLSFTAPTAASVGETISLQLLVTDNDDLIDSDILTITLLPPAAAVNSKVKAGFATVDSSGQVGASAGQYADIACSDAAFGDPSACSGTGRVYPDQYDPQMYSSIKFGTYGVQSRTTVRALVVEGNNGKRVALLKSDNYLAQDMVSRRVAQLLEGGDSGIGYEQILHFASHNHSSPYQFTQSPGLWIFQDQFNQYQFEQMCRNMAAAIEQAAAKMVPVRMSATTIEHTIVKANIVRGSVAKDGTPAGYPVDFGDTGLVVMRLDDVSVEPPVPMAFWVNHGEHPESLNGYHLITADFLGAMERYVERELGAPLMFTQGDVGSAEGPYSGDAYMLTGRYEGLWAGFGHEGYAQMERAGRFLADAVTDANNLIDAQDASVTVPWNDDFPVDYYGYWVAGPPSHPSPTLSNCDASETYQGDVGAPAAGLPDCARQSDNAGFSFEPVIAVAGGLPSNTALPSHYSAPAHPAVLENQRLHLQAFRFGEVLMASCACEPQVDLILNLESRIDNVADNIYDGYDWSHTCEQQDNGNWLCSHPRRPDEFLPEFSDDLMQHMLAQVHNDAKGWENPANVLAASGQEPDDHTKIWGNFTKEELAPELGYALPVGIGHAGDYNGYTVSYREYMSRDSYRKALTTYGPHTADYMNTRLVKMAGKLKGGADLPAEPAATTATGASDEQRQDAQAQQLGAETQVAYESAMASHPNDMGDIVITQQPLDVQHFSAATVKWVGGSNAVDNPQITVEIAQGSNWVQVADMTGEIQTIAQFPTSKDEQTAAQAGQFTWNWQANFEAFPAFPTHNGSTEFGRYRFVIKGNNRRENATDIYTLISQPFTVSPWQGIQVSDVKADGNGDVSFVVEPIVYPLTYDSDFHFMAFEDRSQNCRTCTFMPWAKTGTVTKAAVEITRANGDIESVAANYDSDSGRYIASASLAFGDTFALPSGFISDNNGETN